VPAPLYPRRRVAAAQAIRPATERRGKKRRLPNRGRRLVVYQTGPSGLWPAVPSQPPRTEVSSADHRTSC